MIWNPVDGQEYGTAAELAQRLTKHCPATGRIELVTPGMVRSWHYSHGLTKHRMRNERGRPMVVYPALDAAVCCRRTADTPQGRTRQLDLQPA